MAHYLPTPIEHRTPKRIGPLQMRPMLFLIRYIFLGIPNDEQVLSMPYNVVTMQWIACPQRVSGLDKIFSFNTLDFIPFKEYKRVVLVRTGPQLADEPFEQTAQQSPATYREVVVAVFHFGSPSWTNPHLISATRKNYFLRLPPDRRFPLRKTPLRNPISLPGKRRSPGFRRSVFLRLVAEGVFFLGIFNNPPSCPAE